MEFEFRKDFISEQATAKLSMGHEAFATWLEQEGQHVDWIENLQQKIMQLQSRLIVDFTLPGSEFSLLVNQQEARVVHHSLMNEVDESDLEVDLNFYDLEIQAACGLEDFLHLIASWFAFVKE